MSILNEHDATETRSSVLANSPYTYIERDTVRHQSRWHEPMPADLFRYRFIKRALDIFLVLSALPVLIPLVAVTSALVRLNSPGPIFFSHRRIRKNGAFFSMWKFRTMCVNSTEVLDDYLQAHPRARAEWFATRKLRHDPRVTSIGRFMRRFSLDEVPQVWNVLFGTMSLVGPRPIIAAEVEKYGDHFQSYCRVKPGLTGLWQVSGRSELSYDARVALDCEYVQKWSLSRDMVILAKTFVAVFRQNGAF